MQHSESACHLGSPGTQTFHAGDSSGLWKFDGYDEQGKRTGNLAGMQQPFLWAYNIPFSDFMELNVKLISSKLENFTR
jgi:hypothetical protein